MKSMKFAQQPAIPQRVFAAVAFPLLLLALATNHNASAQTMLTPPITLSKLFRQAIINSKSRSVWIASLIKKSRLDNRHS
jgi:hypothetical protein